LHGRATERLAKVGHAGAGNQTELRRLLGNGHFGFDDGMKPYALTAVN
jgi:hypothetical protein